jgi:hypothetical protein
MQVTKPVTPEYHVIINIMKLKLGLLFILLPFFSIAQSSIASYDNFIRFVGKNYRANAEIRRNCDWQYAVVKVNVDGNNRIVDYTILNEVTGALKNSFKYLQGYQFDKTIPIKKQPVVFYFTIQNDNDDCDVKPQNHLPSEATIAVFSVFNEQFLKEPQTIFIYEPVLCRIYATVR